MVNIGHNRCSHPAHGRHRRTALLCVLLLLSSTVEARETFRIAWTTYIGWMPWHYADQHGIIKKWADKYHIQIEMVHLDCYRDSLLRYTSGDFDGCAMTNMDALTIPAAQGVDSTALIIGDFSNGNDGIVLKGKQQLNALAGHSIHLAEGSVSHYLLARALQIQGMNERDVHTIDLPDDKLVAAYATPAVTATATWNPHLSELLKMADSHKVFDSSYIPGEIIDLMVVRSDRLASHPELGKALTGAWYEVMSIMSGADERAQQARTEMGEAAGTDLIGYEAQMAATRMFYQPQDAANFAESPELAKTMQQVADFAANHGRPDKRSRNSKAIGIEMPAGSYGDQRNIKLRFTGDFMRQAAAGKL